MRGGMTCGLPSTGPARLFAAAVILVDRGPGAAFGFLLAHALLLVAFGDMVGLALLLGGVF